MLSVYHMTAFTIGFVMDLLFGDPYWLPHPIRWIGRLIGWLDRKLLGETDGAVRNEAAEKKKGRWLVAFVLLPVLFFAAAVLFAAYRIHPAAGVVTESVMTYQMLATKCLKTESMKVPHLWHLCTFPYNHSRILSRILISRSMIMYFSWLSHIIQSHTFSSCNLPFVTPIFVYF